jgi:hypothetical protein
MRKSFIFIVLICFFQSTSLFAQKIVFCTGVSESGVPAGVLTKLSIEGEGSSVKIFYSQALAITDPVFIFLDKEKDGVFEEYVTEKKDPSAGKKWIAFDYKFTKPGNYRVKVMDKNISELASAYFTVTMFGAETSTTVETNIENSDKVTSDYYASCNMFFCEKVENGNAVAQSKSFAIPEEGRVVTMQIKQSKPLKTEKLIVDFWLKDSKNEYKEYVDTKNYIIEKTWNQPSFKYTFTKPGEYKVMVYNGDQTHIVSGFVTIIKL